jgi:hypothetical protein
MKILFCMTHFGYIRNYESTLRLLAEKGHRIQLCFIKGEKIGESVLVERLVRECPAISYSNPFKRPEDLWLPLTKLIRMLVDYIRYLHPRYAKAAKLRGRAESRVPKTFQALLRLPLVRTPFILNLISRGLILLERSLPLSPDILLKIRSAAPDVVLITPMVELASEQLDYLKCAQALGIPTGVCVHSWDNLTNKGLIKLCPDMVAVWNEAQKMEAIELHGVDTAKVAVTGAPNYDQWFKANPSTDRQAFCRRVGLDPDKPYILYVCSSPFIAENEVPFIRKWLSQLRNSENATLREVGVLVRPHPQNTAQWENVSLAEFGNAVLWPRTDINPIDADSRAVYFDSLFHCAAVMGVNTSALIEAGVVGRPVLTLSTDDFANTQDGTLHFHHLLNIEGGLLSVAKSFAEHEGQLIAALSASGFEIAARPPFIEAFVRPAGIDKPATPILVDAIERLGRQKAAAASAPLWTVPVRFILRVLTLMLAAWNLLTDPRPANWAKKGRIFSKWFAARLVNPCKNLGNKIAARILRIGAVSWFVNSQIMTRITPQTTRWTEMWAKREVKNRIQPLRNAPNPLIVGPWLSEVGFEVLYWAPFLRWIKANYLSDRQELIVVSRGGPKSWYADIANRYVDVLDCFSPDEFRAKNELRMSNGKQKQKMITDLDREIVEYVKRTLSLERVNLIHPLLMYNVFYPHWKGFVSPEFVQGLTSYKKIIPPENPVLAAQLPRGYVAVKFYFSYAFPDNPDNRRFVTRVIESLAERTPVVLLNTPFALDEHRGFSSNGKSRIHSIADFMRPSDNLEIQTQVVSRASAFVGTYGGFSYIAPLCGVDALSFYSEPSEFNAHHHELAQRVCLEHGLGSLNLVHTRDAGLFKSVFSKAFTEKAEIVA